MKHKHVHRFFNGKQKFDLMTSSGPKVEISNIFFSKHTSKTFDDSGGFCRCCCLLLVACCLLVVVFFFNCPTGCGIRSMNRSYQWCVFRSGSCLTCLWTTRSNHERDGEKKHWPWWVSGYFPTPCFFFFSDVNFCHPKPVFLGAKSTTSWWFFFEKSAFRQGWEFFTHRDFSPCQEANH